MREPTLRDLRRAVARKMVPSSDGTVMVIPSRGQVIHKNSLALEEYMLSALFTCDDERDICDDERDIAQTLAWNHPVCVTLDTLARALDRAISLYGPDWDGSAPAPRQGEARPKDTTEVAPATEQDDGALHGGDGASGEVEDSSPTGGEGEGEGESEGEAEEEGEADAEGGGEGEADAEEGGEGEAEGGDDASPTQDNPAWGGINAYLRPKKVDRRVVRRIESYLDRLFGLMEQGAWGTPSPRLAPRRLAREVAQRSYRISRCHRREQEIRYRLLLVDVSGSCSASCQELLDVAHAVATAATNVAVILHSNGQPVAVEDPTGCLPAVSSWQDTAGFWDAILALPLAGCVAFGDHDAVTKYRRIASQTPLVWLDSYAAFYGPAPASRKWRAWAVHSWQKKPLACIQGVSKTLGVVRGLALALRIVERGQGKK